MLLFSGSSNLPLAEEVSSLLSIPLGKTDHQKFQNGELRVRILDEVMNKDVCILQSCSDPVDSHLMEFALMTDALVRAGAQSVSGVVPWLGYSLQDKVFRSGEPMAAKVAAQMLSLHPLKRMILMDLHSNSVAGFFSVPTVVLSSFDVYVQDVKSVYGGNLSDVVVVSPDFGGIKRAHVFADALKVPMVSAEKQRDLESGAVTAVIRDAASVKDKTCIVLDDVINTGSTIIEVARVLKELGAKKVVFYATHGLFAGDSASKLQESAVDEVVVSNSIDLSAKHFPKLRVLSVAPVIADALKSMA